MKKIPYIIAIFFLFTLFVLPAAKAGDAIRQNREVSPFTSIDAGGALQIFLTQGNGHELILEGDPEYLADITTEVKNGVLKISHETKERRNHNKEIKVYISFEELEGLKVSGACSVVSDTPIQSDDLKFSLSGASKATLQIETNTFDAHVSGACKVDITGNTTEHSINSSGAVKYDALGFNAEIAHVKASGASKIDVAASKELQAHSSGATKINYKGSPGKVDVRSSGAGDIKQVSL